jgi:hypothetical protein
MNNFNVPDGFVSRIPPINDDGVGTAITLVLALPLITHPRQRCHRSYERKLAVALDYTRRPAAIESAAVGVAGITR